MSTAEVEVVEAFTSVGITPERAMAAAAALNKRDALSDVSGVKSDVAVMKWMLGFNIAMTVAVLLKLFVH
jgi:hypothetical protein